MKRLFDIAMASILIIILIPIMMVIMVAVQIKLGSPSIFKQQRSGYQGESFYIYKFRTMTTERDQKQQLYSDEIRLTSYGKFLRRYSLDEIPQLFNVLKGEMSFVGPRPLLMEYLLLYNEQQLRRFEVKPGITGWAQINGRNAICWEEKFKLDLWYVDNHSFFLDIKILLITLIRVFRPKDITQPSQATAERFVGNIEKTNHDTEKK